MSNLVLPVQITALLPRVAHVVSSNPTPPAGKQHTPSQIPCPSTRRYSSSKSRNYNHLDSGSTSTDAIHELMRNPVLFDPLRAPRYPIVLCHGLYGFDTRGPTTFPSMRMNYWSKVLSILRDKVGAEVIVTSVPPTGSVSSRAEALDEQLRKKAVARGVNFLAHSMGGLDCRHLITHVKPQDYTPLSLTTIATPHRGSPFMDWCAENLGLGKLSDDHLVAGKPSETDHTKASATPGSPEEVPLEDKTDAKPFSLSLSSLPSSFTTMLLSILDSPAYANLTSTYLNKVFNPSTPNDPNVKYFSVAGRMGSVNIWHPFWLPKMVLDGVEEKEREKLRARWETRPFMYGEDTPLWARESVWGNDGLVTVQSAMWGEFLGILEGCDHWEMRGARGIEFGVDLPAFPAIGLSPSTGPTATEQQQEKQRQSKENQSQGLNWLTRNWLRKGSAPQDISGEKVKTDQQHEADVMKASTEKLSAVFDWIGDQVPDASLPIIGVGNALGAGQKKAELQKEAEEQSEMRRQMVSEGKARRHKDLQTRADMEKFFVALSRKLYDAGL